MSEKVIELKWVVDFAETLGEREIVTASIGPDSEALVLAIAPQDKKKPHARFEQAGGASFPRSKVAPYNMGLLEFRLDFSGEIELQNVEEGHPHLQPLLHGEVLIVAARCHYRSGDPEQNAAVYGWQGDLKRRFVIGDGIEDVQVGSDGAIWVSYFDEGVFGNYGWREPIGACGVLRCNADGEIIWRFAPRDDAGFIADCYAMNVAQDATWLCYYTDFPIVRIRPDGTTRSWSNEFTGAHALATDNHRVLLFGGYQGNCYRCVVQEMGANKITRAREIKLTLPDGELPDRVRVRARGAILHLFVGTNWYQLNLAEHDL